MRRFRITITDLTNIDIGVVHAEFVVVAESPAEAEMYLRQFVWDEATAALHSFDMTTSEIPTAK